MGLNIFYLKSKKIKIIKITYFYHNNGNIIAPLLY